MNTSGSGKRILFCRSNPVDPDPRVEREAAALRDAGYQVSIIAWDRTGSLPTMEVREGIILHRLSIQAAYAAGLGNLPALLRWLVGLTVWLVRHRKGFDILHACDFDTVYPALLCKGLCRKRVVYDIFDFYADHLQKTPDWIKEIIRRFDFLAVRWVDAVILVDKSRRRQIQGSRPKKVAVVYNSPRDVYNSIDASRSQKEQTLGLVYVGLLQVERGLLELLHVLDRHLDWHLDLAGFGGDEKGIVARAERMENVHWHGRIAYRRALELTARCDVSIATYDPGIPNHRYASPNKIFEAMMLAHPVIVARNTNMDRIVREWDCGWVVEYGVEEDLEKALTKLADDPSLRAQLGENGREAYESCYSWSTMQARLLGLYSDIDK